MFSFPQPAVSTSQFSKLCDYQMDSIKKYNNTIASCFYDKNDLIENIEQDLINFSFNVNIEELDNDSTKRVAKIMSSLTKLLSHVKYNKREKIFKPTPEKPTMKEFNFGKTQNASAFTFSFGEIKPASSWFAFGETKKPVAFGVPVKQKPALKGVEDFQLRLRNISILESSYEEFIKNPSQLSHDYLAKLVKQFGEIVLDPRFYKSVIYSDNELVLTDTEKENLIYEIKTFAKYLIDVVKKNDSIETNLHDCELILNRIITSY